MDIITLPDFLKMIAALAFVVALMGGLAILIKRLGLAQGLPSSAAQKRLKVIESIPLDPRRRAVLLRCDDKDHLVILGPNGETLIKADIQSLGLKHDES